NVQPGKTVNRAMVARHGNMSHRLTGLLAEPGGDQFVVAPYRAVEEDQRRPLDASPQLVGDAGAGGDKIEILSRRLVRNAQAKPIAHPIVAGRVRLALEIPSALAGHLERQRLDAGG